MIGACFALVMFFSFSSVMRHSDPGHYWETSCSAASISSTSRFVRLPFFRFLSISAQFIPIGVEIKAMEEGNLWRALQHCRLEGKKKVQVECGKTRQYLSL
ncbi:hypothetical protein B0H14DRAFT_3883210, partial [Mycena olivaceomarginata]